MAKFLRYALATVCFAASVGCFAVWWRSFTYWDTFISPVPGRNSAIVADFCGGAAMIVRLAPRPKDAVYQSWGISSTPTDWTPEAFAEEDRKYGRFGVENGVVSFPIWFPGLLLALVGITAVQAHRRFTLRSVLITTTAVAALLGFLATFGAL